MCWGSQAHPNLRGLAEGGQLEDPAGFIKRMNDLILALSAK